jgi:flavin-dependent dehydrogenase
MPEQFDVAVVGGGPAGTAAAMALARSGLTVAVLERLGYDQARIGETLPPVAQLPLARLGVWKRFLDDGHLPSPGNLSAWGQVHPDESHFIFSPYGDGWHLDRRRFDAMLAQVAEEAGAQVQRAARVTACLPTARAGWQVEYQTGREQKSLRAGLLIDASGRAPSPARQPATRRISHDRLVGLSAFFSAPGPDARRDARTLVEAVKDGWWYSAWLPNSRLVVIFMTDADLKPKGRASTRAYWLNRLACAPHTRLRVEGCRPETGVGIVAANTYLLNRVTGPNWLAVGDSASTYDPLSSLGICNALESGLQCSLAVQLHFGGDPAALTEYELWTQARFAEYMKMRGVHYGRERRWPRSIFWQRRQQTKL